MLAWTCTAAPLIRAGAFMNTEAVTTEAVTLEAVKVHSVMHGSFVRLCLKSFEVGKKITSAFAFEGKSRRFKVECWRARFWMSSFGEHWCGLAIIVRIVRQPVIV